jgi:tetratricopeptide (TPR) repeat protein
MSRVSSPKCLAEVAGRTDPSGTRGLSNGREQAEKPETAPLALLRRFHLPGGHRPLDESLRDVAVEPHIIQDFRPMTRSLEWQLSELYWTTQGVKPFITNEVPNLVNNSGRASEEAAALLYANCLEAERLEERIVVLELGAGLGLFARLFLDAFRATCAREGRNFYDRLVYFVSDQSPRMVQQWDERGLFAEHAGHVVLGTCDARRPAEFQAIQGPALPFEALRAIFANYLLDVLPAAIVRAGPAGPEQLCVRTHLRNSWRLLPQYTSLSLEEVRSLASSENAEDRARLFPILRLLEFETRFLPVGNEALPYLDDVLACSAGLDRTVLNHGALDCLQACLALLLPSGFVLVNDYGPNENGDVPSQAAYHRFGCTTALGLNFPFLEQHFTARHKVVQKPEGDERRPIHSRLLTHLVLPGTAAAFRDRYSLTAYEYFETPAAEAREHLMAGRVSDALASFRTAVGRSPRDWHLIGRAAEFVTVEMKDHNVAMELIRAALELNPTCSAWLWNVLGDCLFYQGRGDEAREAYLQAEQIDANDVQTNYNLACVATDRGAFVDALGFIARGLANDPPGTHRMRLLDKQQQILTAMSSRWLEEQGRASKRAAAFSLPPAAPG